MRRLVLPILLFALSVSATGCAKPLKPLTEGPHDTRPVLLLQIEQVRFLQQGKTFEEAVMGDFLGLGAAMVENEEENAREQFWPDVAEGLYQNIEMQIVPEGQAPPALVAKARITSDLQKSLGEVMAAALFFPLMPFELTLELTFASPDGAEIGTLSDKGGISMYGNSYGGRRQMKDELYAIAKKLGVRAKEKGLLKAPPRVSTTPAAPEAETPEDRRGL